MKRLVIDFDDVICDNQFLQCYNEFFKCDKKHSDFENYYIDATITDPDEKRAFGEYLVERNFYKGAVLKQHAKESLEMLEKKYNVYICTAYYMGYVRDLCGAVLQHKYEFVAKNLPNFDMSKIIFTNSKSVVDADIIIDDNLYNLLTNNAHTKILFTAEHNVKISGDQLRSFGIIRANNWEEIVNLLID